MNTQGMCFTRLSIGSYPDDSYKVWLTVWEESGVCWAELHKASKPFLYGDSFVHDVDTDPHE